MENVFNYSSLVGMENGILLKNDPEIIEKNLLQLKEFRDNMYAVALNSTLNEESQEKLIKEYKSFCKFGRIIIISKSVSNRSFDLIVDDVLLGYKMLKKIDSETVTESANNFIQGVGNYLTTKPTALKNYWYKLLRTKVKSANKKMDNERVEEIVETFRRNFCAMSYEEREAYLKSFGFTFGSPNAEDEKTC